ncbi:hypothetical protein DICPUDRAFT_41662 [Dictyostelium purpureum]|uniref:RRM domain-containing protein n=1 Tax=Dictyostelium purpureum TaxID=5786 RepID=F1A0J1_DICPU|nr:uncharacterized protein DICPUDRAFT_41662 [Dictyostelium purpureum]EGC30286.1 hypothetical protein DICPUDRAFT_41662 [Dictyostelium purpureum]|eukprot:XP_003293189.1 hypothetical protein DICPUDRAFT_41662 [Dictyostelium purpureum]
MSNTRICVKQLPKHLTDKRFKEHFEKFGVVTDAKIIKKDGKSRLFGFIGFANENSAKNALSLNGTFIDTSKIVVEIATLAGDSEAQQPWSKYSEGSSANRKVQTLEKEKELKNLKRKQEQLEKKQKKKQVKNQSFGLDMELENDPEYQEFKKLHAQKANSKVWDDNSNIGAAKEEPQEEEKKSKRKIELEAANNKDLLVFEDDDSDAEDLYEDMPVKKQKAESETIIVKKDKSLNDKSVSDLDWLSKFRSNDDSKMDSDKEKDSDEEDDDEEDDDEEDDEEEKDSDKEDKKDKEDKENEENEDNKMKIEDKIKMENPDNKKIKEIKYYEHDYTKEEEDVGDSGRIFIRNLSYTTKEEDLEKVFSKYGKISEIHIPINYESKQSIGIAFILYLIPENAVTALNEMDGKVFQGRIIHVLPAKQAPAKTPVLDGASAGSSYKSEKEKEQKSNSGSTHNWNALFMRSDAIVSSLAERYKMTQGQLLDPNQVDLAVRMTLMETHVINETKKFLEEQGVIITDIGNKGSKRSNTTLLVKNIPFKTDEEELELLFSKFGELARVVLAPARTIALIEYLHPNEAKSGFKNLAYTKFHHVPLYLEWAPEGVFKNPAPPRDPKPKQATAKTTDSSRKETSTKETSTKETSTKETSTKDTKEQPKQKDTKSSSTNQETHQFVFIKNLNWKTSNETLEGKFKSLKDFISVNIATKPNPKKPGERLPCGFGFIEFSSKQGAYECIKRLNGATIDDHEISLKLSDKNEVNVKAKEMPENKRSSLPQNAKSKPSSKIIIKNLPFESTTKEIRKLFAAYGEIQSVRIPKKPNGGHRGFGFVEFLTEEEAKNAMEALGSSHFYGRHLVLQYAEQDKNVDELREKANLDYEKIKNSKF